jgi:hypothetical protein
MEPPMPVHCFLDQLSRASSTSFIELVVDNPKSPASRATAIGRKHVRFMKQGDSCRWSAHPTSLNRIRSAGDLRGLGLPIRSPEEDLLSIQIELAESGITNGDCQLDPKHRQGDLITGYPGDVSSNERALSQQKLCWNGSMKIRATGEARNVSPELGRVTDSSESASEMSDSLPSDCEVGENSSNHDAALSEAIIATIEKLSVRAALVMSRPKPRQTLPHSHVQTKSLLDVLGEAKAIASRRPPECTAIQDLPTYKLQRKRSRGSGSAHSVQSQGL